MLYPAQTQILNATDDLGLGIFARTIGYKPTEKDCYCGRFFVFSLFLKLDSIQPRPW